VSAGPKPAKRGSAKAQKLAGQGAVELPQEIFTEPFHEGIVYEAARAEQLARRRGTASTKTRAEVRGGGVKPWRQKGTGRARAGSIRAPNWTGGGAAFGPAPRSYTVKVNRKARRRALRAALSVHAARETIAVVDPGTFDAPSTKEAADALGRWDAERPVLVLLADDDETCAKSFRNIAGVTVLPATDAGVADVITAASVVVSQGALDALSRLASSSEKAESE
jgi:large subunit ribosomal protein L4